jgi:glycosyltransferase involved in cell wall biosynthesis
MIRICTSLQSAGYDVLLVGRQYADSPQLQQRPFRQKRLTCLIKTGKLFYVEYNLRLFLYGLLKKFDLVCAIDLDTILPCYLLSRLKGCKRVYDAHELFCEMKEIKTRPQIYKLWKWIERQTVPYFSNGYTVNKPIQQLLNQEYGVDYAVIRNVPNLEKSVPLAPVKRYIIYQGAVNEGRSFETCIPAFQHIDCPLLIYGDGNFFDKAVQLVKQYNLQQKVLFKGKLFPEQLRKVTQQAVLGITLFENNGLSNYYSLANRFFDYIQAGIPQLCVAYPVYKEINDQYHIARLIEDLSPLSIAGAINELLADEGKLKELRQNCRRAREELNWQQEEKLLISFYQHLFSNAG